MPFAHFYEPFFSLSDFDGLLGEAVSTRSTGANNDASKGNIRRAIQPRTDVHEDANSTITATFELPGLKKEDVNIDLLNNVLTISGESKISSDRDESGYTLRERRFGKFSRALRLPQGIKDTDIKASMENGILSVTFPKTTPEQASKKITVA